LSLPSNGSSPKQAGTDRALAGREDVEAGLQAVVDRAAVAVRACEAAGLSILDQGHLTSVVGTGPLARQLDGAQCRAGNGPCLDAIRQLQVFAVRHPAEARSWPVFRRAAVAAGVRSGLFVPLTRRGEALGTLSLYSHRADAFDGCLTVGLRLAAQAAEVLGAAPDTDTCGTTITLHREGAVGKAVHPASGPRWTAATEDNRGRTG
jgi:transcriptional regulator with GAF, ATPase, and Fis domain